jgi:hypothetical protein
MGKTYKRSRKEFYDYEEGFDTRTVTSSKKDKAARAKERASKLEQKEQLFDGTDDSNNSPVQTKRFPRKDYHR